MSERERFGSPILRFIAVLGTLSTITTPGGVIFAAEHFNPDSDPIVGYINQPTASSFVLSDTQHQLFLPSYSYLPYWSGDLQSRTIYVDGRVNTTPNWSAREQLDSESLTHDQRKIITYSTGTDGKIKKVPFRWDKLSDAQKTALGEETFVNFVRGDRSLEYSTDDGGEEYGIYRNRASRLGDIVHSVPLYWNDDTEETIFVGANDGMLHAFDGKTGKELFAYIPSLFIESGRLRSLRDIGFARKYFVDGQFAVRTYKKEIKKNSILVGGLGGGGKGLFALNITKRDTTKNAKGKSESQLAKKILLWEVTNNSSGYANLGHTYATPTMVTLTELSARSLGYGVEVPTEAPPPDATLPAESADAAAAAAAAAEAAAGAAAAAAEAAAGDDDDDDDEGESEVIIENRDAVMIMPNGYNSTNGVASLFVIEPDTGKVLKEIVVDQGGPGSTNGLSSPTIVDLNLDGKADLAYAGDLNGNLWRFDLATFNATRAVKVYTTNPPQPITTAPAVTYHPKGGQMVVFGTGKLFVKADQQDTSTHYIYGIWDRPDLFQSNSSLFESTLTEHSYTGVSPARRVRAASPSSASIPTPDWTPGKNMGWRTPLPSGERLVGDGAFIAGSVFVFLSTKPAAIGADNSENWWMQLNAFTGGTDPYNERFDLNLDGQYNNLDQIQDKGGAVGLYIGKGIRSQLTVFSTASENNIYYANANYDPVIVYDTKTETIPPTTVGDPTDPGISGGHFDYDSYHGDSGSIKHHHEYDDKHNVTGVNMLDSAESAFNLGGIIGNDTEFKVIAANQYLNPAVEILVDEPFIRDKGGPTNGYIPLRQFSTQATAAEVLSKGPYKVSTIKGFAINMPVDAFAVNSWWSNGGVPAVAADNRVGLMPTQTGCVVGGALNRIDALTRQESPTGVAHNGALILQVVKADTPESALELNVPGKAEYGWRVQPGIQSQWVLAEYTIFWHYKGNGCFQDSSWRKDPERTIGGGNGKGAGKAGKGGGGGGGKNGGGKNGGGKNGGGGGNDPQVLDYFGASGTPGAGGTIPPTVGGGEVEEIINDDGSTTIIITTITRNADGSITKTIQTMTISESGDIAMLSTEPCSYGNAGCTSSAPIKGRVNWREIRR
jgi:Neisseria PilC beta-propeller domain